MVLLLALNIKFTENKKVSFYTRVRKSRRPGQLYAAGGRGFKAIPSITRPMQYRMAALMRHPGRTVSDAKKP